MSEQLVLPLVCPNTLFVALGDKAPRGLGNPYMQYYLGNEMYGYMEAVPEDFVGKSVIIRQMSTHSMKLELA